MKSSDLLTEALHVPLLAMTSSAGVLVLACYFAALWLALLAAMLVVFFMRSAWRRARWMTWTTMQEPQHEHTEEARTHSLPWILGACFGLRLFAQPSECDVGQSRGASGATSRVADGGGRDASSLGQRLPCVSACQTGSDGEHGRGDYRGPHNISEDVDGAAELEPVHVSLLIESLGGGTPRPPSKGTFAKWDAVEDQGLPRRHFVSLDCDAGASCSYDARKDAITGWWKRHVDTPGCLKGVPYLGAHGVDDTRRTA